MLTFWGFHSLHLQGTKPQVRNHSLLASVNVYKCPGRCWDGLSGPSGGWPSHHMVRSFPGRHGGTVALMTTTQETVASPGLLRTAPGF